jgi:hypothetical protein
MMTRTLLGCSITLTLALAGCSSSDDAAATGTGGSGGTSTGGSSTGGSAGKGTGGTSPAGGTAGAAGSTGGKGGTAGTAGTGGKGGSAGSGGKGGSAGTAGTGGGGAGGAGGKGGSAGAAGGGAGGSAGASGKGGSAGVAGAGGGGAGGKGGSAGAAGAAGVAGAAGIGGAAGSGGIGGSAGSAGSGGTGGSGGSAIAYPAAHQPAPTIKNYGGPVLVTPKIVPIFFTDDADATVTDLTDFLTAYVQSTAFSGVSEYGVGAATVAPPVKVTLALQSTVSDSDISNWLADRLDADDAAIPAADDNTLYVVFAPSGKQVNVGGSDLCQLGLGTHEDFLLDAAHGSRDVAVAIVPRCANFSGLSELDAAGYLATGAVVSAVTDPYPFNTPAFASYDDEHAMWAVWGTGEVGGACAWLSSSLGVNASGLSHPVASVWSNTAALASHDPCAPSAATGPYFAAAPVLDLVSTSFSGQTLMTRGVKIPVGQMKTIEVDLFSDADSGGPWNVKALDGQTLLGKPAALSLSLSPSSGINGDKLMLTITSLSAGPGNRATFLLTSSQAGGPDRSIWVGLVTNGSLSSLGIKPPAHPHGTS